MMRRSLGRCRLLVLVLLPALAGCASQTALFDRVDSELERGSPERALSSLEALSDSGRNESLYWLNRGMLLRMSGDLEGSVAAFERAKAVIGQLEPISVSETIAAWTFAEDSGAYLPPTHEHLLLHTYQALNFLELGRLDAARVEALQIDLGLRRIDPADGRAPLGGDAFPRYVSGLIFEANRDWSDALIAYRKAYQAYQRQGRPIPRDLRLSLVRFTDYLELTDERDDYLAEFGISEWPAFDPRDDRASIVVVVHDGLAPRLREEGVVVPHPSENRLIRVSLPALQSRPSRLSRVRLVVDGRQADGEVAEDVSGNADRWLSSLMPGITARVVSRNVTRDVATRQIERENELLGFLFNVAGTVLDNADTRSWRTLPHQLHLVRLEVPAGPSHVRLELLDRGGRVLDVVERTMDVRPGGTAVATTHWVGGVVDRRRWQQAAAALPGRRQLLIEELAEVE